MREDGIPASFCLTRFSFHRQSIKADGARGKYSGKNTKTFPLRLRAKIPKLRIKIPKLRTKILFFPLKLFPNSNFFLEKCQNIYPWTEPYAILEVFYGSSVLISIQFPYLLISLVRPYGSCFKS